MEEAEEEERRRRVPENLGLTAIVGSYEECGVGVVGRECVLVAVAVELELHKGLRHEALRRLCGDARGNKSSGLELDALFSPFFS